jgi:hypothetical protein
MEYLNKIGNIIYAYCTDFIINLANVLELSYYEVNALLFCFIYPALTICLLTVYFIQKKRLKHLKNNSL